MSGMYINCSIVFAEPMTKQEYNDECKNDVGYKIFNSALNHTSWVPENVFNKSFKKIENDYELDLHKIRAKFAACEEFVNDTENFSKLDKTIQDTVNSVYRTTSAYLAALVQVRDKYES